MIQHLINAVILVIGLSLVVLILAQVVVSIIPVRMPVLQNVEALVIIVPILVQVVAHPIPVLMPAQQNVVTLVIIALALVQVGIHHLTLGDVMTQHQLNVVELVISLKLVALILAQVVRSLLVALTKFKPEHLQPVVAQLVILADLQLVQMADM